MCSLDAGGSSYQYRIVVGLPFVVKIKVPEKKTRQSACLTNPRDLVTAQQLMGVVICLLSFVVESLRLLYHCLVVVLYGSLCTASAVYHVVDTERKHYCRTPEGADFWRGANHSQKKHKNPCERKKKLEGRRLQTDADKRSLVRYSEALNTGTTPSGANKIISVRLLIVGNHPCENRSTLLSWARRHRQSTATSTTYSGRKVTVSIVGVLTLIGPQCRCGDKQIKFQVVCPQNGAAVVKGSR